MKHTQNKKGFTLVELLVVVLIIGILTAVALPQYSTAVEKSRAAEALTLMSALAGSVERYRLQKDFWPCTSTSTCAASSAFTKLDVEMPMSGTVYRGKSFILSMEPGNTSDVFKVHATRDLPGTQQYRLSTIITEQANGTFRQERFCYDMSTGTPTAPAISSGNVTEASKFCYAVTNGHASDGKF